MASMNVSIPEPMRGSVEQRLASGHYASLSEYVDDLTRRDEAEADEREAIVAALVKGERSGVSKRRLPEILAAVAEEFQAARISPCEGKGRSDPDADANLGN